MLTALITGITGQDGLYLAELLIKKGYRVIGAVRYQGSPVRLAPVLLDNIELVDWDMMDQDRMVAVLKEYHPTEIYNLAGYSSGARMYDDPIAMQEVNGLAITRMLDAILQVDINMRFCQATSREIFGEAYESP